MGIAVKEVRRSVSAWVFPIGIPVAIIVTANIARLPISGTAMRRSIPSWLMAFVLAASLIGQVEAGQFEDAIAAYRRGDYATALLQFRSLADQGDARAQNNLGMMYDTGQGVLENYNEAAKWFRRAADQGDACQRRHKYASVRRSENVSPLMQEGVVRGHLPASRLFVGCGVRRWPLWAARWRRLLCLSR